jgi:hypothetical protein
MNVNNQKRHTLHHIIRPKFLVHLFSLFITFSVYSCKESDTLGGNLLPDSDQSPFKGTSKFNITAFTVKEDSIKSDDLTYSLLGSYVDPVFGKSSASFITQFISGSNQLDFGVNPIADSIVLSMAYHSYYGKVNKLNGLQKIKIYSVSNSIFRDSSYYSSENPIKYATESDLISEHTILPDPSGKYQSGTPVQKFRLPVSFAQNILNNQSTINSSGFTSFFKGFYFKPSNEFQTTGNGAILSFNLLSAEAPAKFTIYFHNDSDPLPQQISFNVTSDCARINFFKHERNGIPAINNQLNDTTQGKTQLFIQNMAGLSSKIWFTNIESWKDSMPIVISKAELILPIETSLIGDYDLQSKLLLVEKDSTGNYAGIPDFNIGEGYFSGDYNPANNTYSFNLAVYLQELISGKRTQKGLYLVPTASAVGANRVVLKGSNFIKLNVTYSKIR